MIEIVIGSTISFLIGWNLSENHTRRKLKNYVKNKMEADLDEPEFERIQIRIEKHGEELFAYRVDNGTFLSQSKSGKELVASIKELFKDQMVNIVIHHEDGAEYVQEYF